MEPLTVNILDAIQEDGEAETASNLSSFCSPLNREIEDFIRNKAIDFAKRKLSVTYLVVDPTDGEIIGYFALAHKVIDISGDDLSKTSIRKLERFSKYDADENTYTTSAFLLAQFGKNFAVDNGRRVHGSELMDYAMDILADVQHLIGGGIVYLDAEDKPKLKSFYENEVGFKCFGERYSEAEKVKYLQYLKFL